MWLLKKSCVLQTQRPSPWQGSDGQKLEAVTGKDHSSLCFKCQEASSPWVEPGNSLKFAKKMDKKILILKQKQKTREYKKKRIAKKAKQLKKTKQLENREGQQYSSGMGFDGHDAAQEISAPPAASKIEKVSLTKDYHQIIFELETSGRGNDAEILQIAATDGNDEFSIYIKPRNVLSPEASAVNKLTFQRAILFYDGKPITDAVAIDVALKTFIEWLKSRMPCILVAHNCKSFDARFLVQAAEKNGVMDDFKLKQFLALQTLFQHSGNYFLKGNPKAKKTWYKVFWVNPMKLTMLLQMCKHFTSW